MTIMKSYRDLVVWQKGVKLVTEIYKITAKFPKSEIFGLTSQMRRAAASIPANLAEGYARRHRTENLQFVKISFGSGAELETFLLIAQNLGYVSKADVKEAEALLDEVMRMLNKLGESLAAKI
jgi:four helix bundle protein